MSSVITNIYNKKTKGRVLMELFRATGKLKVFFFLTTTDADKYFDDSSVHANIGA